jgi:hypothetical protein
MFEERKLSVMYIPYTMVANPTHCARVKSPIFTYGHDMDGNLAHFTFDTLLQLYQTIKHEAPHLLESGVSTLMRWYRCYIIHHR